MLTKRITSISAICIIFIASFVLPYTSVPVYADTQEQQEEFYEIGSDSKSLAAAIQAYVNGRNVWFLSQNSKAFIAWATNEIERNQADLAILQHNIFSTINRLNPITGTILKFQYKTNAISVLNKYFNEWRNKYGLSTQEGKTEKVYSGEVFEDDDGNGCLVYRFNNLSLSDNVGFSTAYSISPNDFIDYGTYLKYPTSDFISQQNQTITFNINQRVYNYTVNYGTINQQSTNNKWVGWYKSLLASSYQSFYGYSDTDSRVVMDGCITVFKTNNKYYLGSVGYFNPEKHSLKDTWNVVGKEINITPDPADIDIHTPSYPANTDVLVEPDSDVLIEPKNKTTNKPFSINDSFNDYSKVVNNYIDNSVTNNTTSIVNPTEEPEEPDPEPEPNLPDEDGIWSEPNDEGGYNYHWDTPSGLPDFNFSLPVQLERKFPFCMPFDLLAIFTIFNGEPETPTLEGQIHIGYGSWRYVWDLSTLDVDLHDFDSTMAKVRSVERLGFLIALTFLTMRLFNTAY